MWIDAGIRDMFNASVSANAGGGIIAGRYGLPLGTYDGFAAFGDSSSETTYDFATVPWASVPRNVLLRYGDPDATEAKIEQGDGRHVGTAAQIETGLLELMDHIDATYRTKAAGDVQISP